MNITEYSEILHTLAKTSREYDSYKDLFIDDDGDLCIARNGDSIYELLSYNGGMLQNDIYDFHCVQHFGGEGKGETYYYVFKLTNLHSGDEYFIKDYGYYDSWNGTTWDYDPIFVKPVEKTITVYE